MKNRILNILEEFDKENKNILIDDILQEINKLNCSDFNEEENYERIGFYLVEMYGDKISKWNMYWGPTYVFLNKESVETEFPSLESISDECLNYWKSRIDEVKNPILAFRYCNLAIEFMQLKHPDENIYDLYKKAINNAIIIYENDLYKYDIESMYRLERSFNLAKKINDIDGINKIKNIIIEFDEKIDDSYPGIWGLSFRLFILKNKKCTNEQEKERIINLLEQRLDRLTNTDNVEEVNSNSVEKVCENLAIYYRNINKKDEVLRVLKKLQLFYEKRSENQLAIQKHVNFEKVYNLYKEFGFKEESNKMLVKISNLGKDINESMTCISDTLKISKKEMDTYLDFLLKGNLNDSIKRIVERYIPKKNEIVDSLKKEAKEFPLQYLFGKRIIDEEGRVIGEIGNIEDDLDGNIIFKMTQNMQISSFFMNICLNKLIEKYNVCSDQIIELLKNTPIIIEGREEILKKGIDAYLNKDYITSINILVPQIEYMFRKIIELQGGNILKVNKQCTYQLITFDQVLRDEHLVDIFSEDVMIYLRVLFTDQRGWNIRNNVCHGLIAETHFSKKIADRIIHVIFLLCQVIYKEDDEH